MIRTVLGDELASGEKVLQDVLGRDWQLNLSTFVFSSGWFCRDGVEVNWKFTVQKLVIFTDYISFPLGIKKWRRALK